jgi:hypothetical protein
MEHLFTTELITSGKSTAYEVMFNNEHYSFSPISSGDASVFQLSRIHDEWHGSEDIPQPLRAQAIKALDDYLLAQH